MEPSARWEDVEAHVIAKSLADEDFRRRLVEDPRGTLQAELARFSESARIPESLDIKVIEEQPTTVHIVLPPLPEEAPDERVWETMDLMRPRTRRTCYSRCTCSAGCCA